MFVLILYFFIDFDSSILTNIFSLHSNISHCNKNLQQHIDISDISWRSKISYKIPPPTKKTPRNGKGFFNFSKSVYRETERMIFFFDLLSIRQSRSLHERLTKGLCFQAVPSRESLFCLWASAFVTFVAERTSWWLIVKRSNVFRTKRIREDKSKKEKAQMMSI